MAAPARTPAAPTFKYFRISIFFKFQIFPNFKFQIFFKFQISKFFFSWQPRVGLSLHRRWGLSALTLGAVSPDAGAVRTNAGCCQHRRWGLSALTLGAVSPDAGRWAPTLGLSAPTLELSAPTLGAVSSDAGGYAWRCQPRCGALGTDAGAVRTNAGRCQHRRWGFPDIFPVFFC